jgi:hypothetical protein
MTPPFETIIAHMVDEACREGKRIRITIGSKSISLPIRKGMSFAEADRRMCVVADHLDKLLKEEVK